MDVAKLLAEIGGEQATTLNKVASADSSSMEKLAEELDAGGRLMADGFVNRTVELLNKLAMDRASSSHAAGKGVEEAEMSNWNTVAQKLQRERHGSGAKKKPLSQMVEGHYPNVARGAHHA